MADVLLVPAVCSCVLGYTQVVFLLFPIFSGSSAFERVIPKTQKQLHGSIRRQSTGSVNGFKCLVFSEVIFSIILDVPDQGFSSMANPKDEGRPTTGS